MVFSPFFFTTIRSNSVIRRSPRAVLTSNLAIRQTDRHAEVNDKGEGSCLSKHVLYLLNTYISIAHLRPRLQTQPLELGKVRCRDGELGARSSELVHDVSALDSYPGMCEGLS
jgi:hypothetical protein